MLDFIIVNLSIVSMLMTAVSDGGGGLRSLSALRALRALRPLRMIQRAPQLKLVVNALIAVVPDVVNVLLICLLIFLMFGIICVQYFKGRFNACQGDRYDVLSGDADLVALMEAPLPWDQLSVTQKGWFTTTPASAAVPKCDRNLLGSDDASSVYIGDGAAGDDALWNVVGASGVTTSRMMCACMGASWDATVPQSFDNIGLAILTLFELTTTEAWVDVMLASVDAPTEIDNQPIRDRVVIWCGFYILFMVIGAFLAMQLFVGQYHNMPCRAVPRRAVPRRAAPCRAVPRRAAPCHTVP